MKKYIAAFVFSALFVPALSLAATVSVMPDLTTGFAGNHPSNPSPLTQNIAVCIYAAGSKQCGSGSATFSIADGSNYQVLFSAPPTGYTYTTDANCTGVAQGDITCHVSYVDGPVDPNVYSPLPMGPYSSATVDPTADQPAQVSAPASVTSPVSTSIELPTPEQVASIATSSEEQAQIAALQAQIVQLLQQLIVLLQAKLVTLKSA